MNAFKQTAEVFSPNIVDAALPISALTSVRLLNEIAAAYPGAISFAAGRPNEAFFPALPQRLISSYLQERSQELALDRDEVWKGLCQYGATAGFILDDIAKQLANDESISVDPRSIVVTAGSQEAMSIILHTLFTDPAQVLFVPESVYVGLTGLAQLLRIDVCAIPCDADGIIPMELCRLLEGMKPSRRARAIYCIPNFNNPTGCFMPLNRRKELLSLCEQFDVFLIEDDPYGMYNYDSMRLPSCKALDTGDRVFYIGTYSKTVCPGLRLGFVVFSAQRFVDLTDRLIEVKGLLALNTSAASQALLAGFLRVERHTLVDHLRAPIVSMRSGRDALVRALESEQLSRKLDLRWSCPSGGFFMTVDLPCSFLEDDMRICARDYGVLACPMSLFHLKGGHHNSIRLAFSNLPYESLHEGVHRLGRYLGSRT